MGIREIWKSIPGYPGYAASTLGRVRSLDRWVQVGNHERFAKGVVLRPGPSSTGHLSVVLGKYRSVGVHKAVMLAFRGPTPEGCEILHKDHDPTNNKLTNLRFGTRTENLLHDYDSGVQRLAKAVKVVYADGREEIFCNCTRAARALGVSQPAVSVALRDKSVFRKTKARVERYEPQVF